MGYTRKDQLPTSTVAYDWDKDLMPIDDDDVEEYRAIEMETKYPAAYVTPWDELTDHLKDVWRKRYKHGS